MIKLITTMACISLGFASISMAQDVVITQNDSCDTDSLGAVACGADGSSAENWFARNILVDQDVQVNSISWGSANPTTVTANIFFSISSGAGNPDANTLTQVGTASQLMDVGGFYTTAVDVPFIVPAGSYLVVEMQFPDSGTDLGVWPATAASPGSTTYLKAADCGITAYTTVDDIGFPDSQIIMCINAGPADFDPCSVALPTLCAADVDGDGAVAVSDVLAIIGAWGSCGDGTFRPVGDIAPLPNGDCCVNVGDVLAVVGSWGADCAVYGSCCMADASCSQMTSADCLAGGGAWTEAGDCATSDCAAGACCLSTTDCADYTADFCSAMGGAYKGDGTACATTDCAAVTPGDTCDIAINVADGANAFDTTNNSLSPDIAECAADAAAFGWTEPVIDIWFSWTAGATDDYVVDTCDVNSFDTSLLVYDACAGSVLACNGDVDAACQIYSSSLVLSATAGTTYIIRIGGWSAADFGTGTLNINVLPPPLPGACCMQDGNCLDGLDSVSCGAFGGVFAGENTLCSDADVCSGGAGSDCANASVAADGANAFDTTLETDSGYGEPDETMCAGTYLNWAGSPDSWMVYTPASNGTLSVSLCDAGSYDTSLVLYEGNDCAALTQVACNGDSTVESGCQTYYSGVYDLPVYADQSIYIRIGGYNADSGPGTATVTFVGGDALGACCMADGSCMDLVSADCEAAGGAWDSSQMCATSDCPQPWTGCDAGSTPDCDECWNDGDDSAMDCNGGANAPTPVYQALALGVQYCGTMSVFVDGPTGGTYRDLDWYTNADVNAGGNFTITMGTSGMGAFAYIYDPVTGVVLLGADVPAGGGVVTVNGDVPAGDYVVLTAPAEWNTDWTCASGLADYTVQVD